MAIRTMRTEGDDILAKTSKAVTNFDKKLWELLDDMKETMDEANGVGLAAVQVGVLRRVFIIDVGDGLLEFINPEIISEEGEQDGVEGCLSFPGQFGWVYRPNKVHIKAQNRNGEWFEVEGEELFARAMCHEYDHLNGKVFKEYVDRLLTQEELDEIYAEEDGEEEEA